MPRPSDGDLRTFVEEGGWVSSKRGVCANAAVDVVCAARVKWQEAKAKVVVVVVLAPYFQDHHAALLTWLDGSKNDSVVVDSTISQFHLRGRDDEKDEVFVGSLDEWYEEISALHPGAALEKNVPPKASSWRAQRRSEEHRTNAVVMNQVRQQGRVTRATNIAKVRNGCCTIL